MYQAPKKAGGVQLGGIRYFTSLIAFVCTKSNTVNPEWVHYDSHLPQAEGVTKRINR